MPEIRNPPRTKRITVLTAVGIALATAVLTASSSGQAVDLALVLVIDNSGSIDASESALQFNGYAEAFESGELVDEMTSGPNGAIAVNVLIFSDNVQGLGGWQIIDGRAAAARFADLLRSAPHTGLGGTHIAQALEAAVMELASCPYPASAATIDLSADGPDNEGEFVSAANIVNLVLAIAGVQTALWSPQTQQNAYRLRSLRDSIAARGVNINCVAIQDPDLQDYFENYVITGKGSFALLASSFQSFRTVIKRKILREVRQGIKRSVQKTTQRPPKKKRETNRPKPEGRSQKSESQDKNGELKAGDKTKLRKEDASGGELQAGSDQATGEMVAVKAPEKVTKEIVVTIRDAETKLPLNQASLSLIGEGTNFEAGPNESLPGQFVVEFSTTDGTKNSLRIDAGGYTPKDMPLDDREPARYEVEVERLPLQFVL